MGGHFTTLTTIQEGQVSLQKGEQHQNETGTEK